MNLRDLHNPFPLEAIHWRAGSVTRDKKKAMALAYLDARDVMDRLDEVCGPDGWQSEFTETATGRVICRLGINVNAGLERTEEDGEVVPLAPRWVWKSDGAGSTDVEGEKGGLSDALKRAAVTWGVGRYIYRLPAPWVPCECDDRGKWRKFTANPWDFVRNVPSPEKPDAKPQPSNGPNDEPPRNGGMGDGFWDNIIDQHGFDEKTDPSVIAAAAADVMCDKITGYKTVDGLTKYGATAKENVEWVKRHNEEEGNRISITYRTQLDYLKAGKEAA